MRAASALAGAMLLSTALMACAPDAAPPDAPEDPGATGEEAETGTDPDETDGVGAGEQAEGDPVSIGGVFDMTGPTADIGQPYAQGVIDYVQWRNQNGGVDGRPIDLIWQDYQYDVAVAESFYSELASAGVPAIIGWGTADTEALMERITEDEITFLSASLAAPLADAEETPFNFVAGVTYSDQMRITLEWISEQNPEAEVAFFHQDGPFGQSALATGEEHADELGLGFESYPMPGGVTDFVPQLTQAESQNPDYIYINHIVGPAAQLVGNLDEFGWDAQVICWNFCTSEGLIELAGGAAEGLIGIPMFGPGNADVPGTETPREFADLQGRSLDDDGVLYLQGWYYGAFVAEAIERMLQDGEEITGPGLRDRMRDMEAFDTGDASAPIDFSPDSHAGMDQLRLFQVEDGEWTQLTDWLSAS